MIRFVRLASLLGLSALPLAGCYVAPAPVVARPVYVRPPPPVYRPPPPVVVVPRPYP